MIPRRVRVPLLMLGVLVLHVAVLTRFTAAGVRPDILVLVAVTAGLTGGAERGATVGFTVGLLGDLFVETPLGLSALSFCMVGFVVGVLQGNILRATWWIAPATAFVASGAGVALYALVAAVVGRTGALRPELALIALVVATVNAGVAVPMLRVTTWAFVDGHPERAYA